MPDLHYSDLQLLHKFFCGSENFTVYDPEKRLKNQGTISLTGNPDFNLSRNGSITSMKFYFGFNKWDRGKKYYYINNPDGTMRWLIPDDSCVPAHLNLYNATTIKARVYKTVTRLLSLFKAGRWLADSFFYVEQNITNAVKKEYGISEEENYSVFTGTRGNQRKIIVAVSKRKEVTHFIKIAVNDRSVKLIQNEIKMLKELSKYDFTTLSIPRVTDSRINGYARLTNVKPAVTIPAQRINDIHIRALAELYSCNHERKSIADSAAWQNISKNIEWMQQHHKVSNGLDEIKSARIIYLLKKLYSTINYADAIPVSVSHGDFTPWNMYCDVRRLYVYDWELSANGIPMLFDLFHFVFQSGVLINKYGYDVLIKELENTIQKYNVQRIINRYKINRELHFRLYLLFTISHYVRIYIEEENLLTQSHWMVDVWLDALEEVNNNS